MDHDDDVDLDKVPLVGKHLSSNPVEDAAAVREPRRWDFFVLTFPFFGCVCVTGIKARVEELANQTRTIAYSLPGQSSRCMAL